MHGVMRQVMKILSAAAMFSLLLRGLVLQAQPPCPPPQLSPPAANPASMLSLPPCVYSYNPSERLDDYAWKTFGPKAFITSAAVAGLKQASNSPSAWGQGGEGYGRRFASNFGGRVVSNTIQLGVEPILGEDSRYFASHRQGFWPRMKDALSRSLLVPARDGRREPPIGRLAGALGSGLISRTWQPDGHRGVGEGLRDGSISFGLYVGSNLLQEATRGLHKHLPF